MPENTQAWLAQQRADLIAVIAALVDHGMDASSYQQALAGVERLLREGFTAEEG